MADYIPAPDAEFNAWQQNFVIRRGGPTPTWRRWGWLRPT